MFIVGELLAPILIVPAVPVPELEPTSIVTPPVLPAPPKPSPVLIVIAPEAEVPALALFPVLIDRVPVVVPELDDVPVAIVIAPDAVVLFAVDIGSAMPAADCKPVIDVPEPLKF